MRRCSSTIFLQSVSISAKNLAMQEIKNYQEKVTFKSQDRKLNVQRLMNEINEMNNLGDVKQVGAVLSRLTQASKEAYQEDKVANETARFFTRSTKSRYQVALTQARNRIVASLSPEMTDQLVNLRLHELHNVLEVLIEKVNKVKPTSAKQNVFRDKILRQLGTSSHIFNVEESKQLTNEELTGKYKSIATLYEYFLANESEIKKYLSNSSIQHLCKTLRDQCQEMELYFKQGKQLHAILDQSDIRLHQLVNEAMERTKTKPFIKPLQQDRVSLPDPKESEWLSRMVASIRVKIAENYPGDIVTVQRVQLLSLDSVHDFEQLNIKLLIDSGGKAKDLSINLNINKTTSAITAGWPEAREHRIEEKREAKREITFKQKAPKAKEEKSTDRFEEKAAPKTTQDE